ncbi:tRNA pseudouridine synthase B [Mycobacterium leprae Kyoto-2]|uniref:tRNA pseudouridine synthase B n=3 Tax=Mycobacterium leprae TaxID=1769 RepID=TRUB_MYCLE|nr:tRNA pseudouridine(55) synthase TruB [Mycobacterium leprae]Q9Z5I4.1 RecName: Full=tRNA pseudouridine synthase B; AltName: Full=tRNA pseudouridine(55) synthase; Short=Psi55 synthase; AltName: Full=tRNA pseudouridylate synthase; AltName: Full=tRNA-uridine isomerase [Mycobacterium leprae TN]CAR71641.1 tRNA pseudouridine 55 synthase [Mycobacterium leprae Br4923]AWV48085.1 tRNA pseudouridine(55) synthase TruB [Mycobacterium leprae]OAR19862.1 tRNA pseudouridine(55) synthase TruB [Mycobacterium lep
MSESSTGAGLGPGIVVIDKPSGMTSHDVVARCRRIFCTRRVGHAGTLDPMATGVLVLGVDRATKILGLLAGASKEYVATIRLGQTTSTEDAEGELLQCVSARHVTDEAIATAIGRLRGDIKQVPSAVSAIKVDGRRAYRLVREGHVVELQARPVRIDRFEVLAVRPGPEVGLADVIDLDVEVECSSGTYIRALARDLGDAFGVGGHLTSLRRTRVGRFELDQAWSLEDLAELPRLSRTLDETCLLMFPRRDLTVSEVEATSNGRPISSAGIDGIYAASDADGRVIALLRDEGPRTKSVVVLHPVFVRVSIGRGIVGVIEA